MLIRSLSTQINPTFLLQLYPLEKITRVTQLLKKREKAGLLGGQFHLAKLLILNRTEEKRSLQIIIIK
jgi:hypothetical protein